MTDTVKHFGECLGGAIVQLGRIAWADRRDFERIIGRPIAAGERLTREGGLFAYGVCSDCGRLHPSGRRINYSKKPSMHACNSLCMGARGPSCECRCGGKNHGAGFVLSGLLFNHQEESCNV
jgi:hypothetical protein